MGKYKKWEGYLSSKLILPEAHIFNFCGQPSLLLHVEQLINECTVETPLLLMSFFVYYTLVEK